LRGVLTFSNECAKMWVTDEVIIVGLRDTVVAGVPDSSAENYCITFLISSQGG